MLAGGVVVIGIPHRRGRILRVRPGHLANFSGASGYMPFVALFSVPISLVAALVSSIVASLRVRALRRSAEPEATTQASRRGAREDLTAYLGLARAHLLWCTGIAAVVGVPLVAQAIDLIYTPSPRLVAAAVILGAGPLVAWLVSTRFLFRRMRSQGPRASVVLGAVAVHLFGVALCLGLAALLGAPIGIPS